MHVNTDELISISDLTSAGISFYVNAAESGKRHFVTRYGKPVAALIGVAEYERLLAASEGFQISKDAVV